MLIFLVIGADFVAVENKNKRRHQPILLEMTGSQARDHIARETRALQDSDSGL
jgi:hypothetical protein